jgi:hypothetical protein
MASEVISRNEKNKQGKTINFSERSQSRASRKATQNPEPKSRVFVVKVKNIQK